MTSETIVFSIFLIFTGAAIVSTAALFTRQSLLVAYMLIGAILGPFGLKFVADTNVIHQASDIGIIFLLFLLGLNLHPQKLFVMIRKATIISLLSSITFAMLGYVVGRLFGFTSTESLLIGAAMMFSSTIIGLKLLPTTILHHRHIGEVMISILLLQDLIAIMVLLFITGAGSTGFKFSEVVLISLSLPTLLLIGYLAQKYILIKLIARFDHVKEYIFLVSIGWCLGMSELATAMKLSAEIGAFIAGVALAANPIALYIAENLKPLRDFFLVMFFFTIGASFNIAYIPTVIVPAIILSIIALVFKPILFKFLLVRNGETPRTSWEVGVRLGQSSEFSLLIAYIAAASANVLISNATSYLIQAMTIITFFVSSYWVVLRFPTPLALTDRMRKD
ncbi:MAG: cation:proton antiporter [Gammaproteobacteria bacterium]